MRTNTEFIPWTSLNDCTTHDQPVLAVVLGNNAGFRDLVALALTAGRVFALPAVRRSSERQLEMVCDTVVRVEGRTAVPVRAPESGGDCIAPSLGALSLCENPGSVQPLDVPTKSRRGTQAGCGLDYQPIASGRDL